MSNYGLAQGFMQGYGFMDRMATNKQSREHSAKRMAREDEAYGRDEDRRLISAFRQGIESGTLDPEIAKQFESRYKVDLKDYLDPEFGSSIEVLEGTVNGKVSSRSPEFRRAFSKVFKGEINSGVGEESENGIIKEKRFRGLVPGPDGQSVMIDLDVLRETPDGEQWYSAPVTSGRSSTDDEVKAVPLEGLLSKLQGHKQFYSAVQNSPELQGLLNQYAALSGAKVSPDKSYGKPFNHPELGMVQEGPNGQINVLKGLDKSSEKYGKAYNHPSLGWVQPGPNGELKQLKTPQTEAGYSDPFNHPELGMVQEGPNGQINVLKGLDKSSEKYGEAYNHPNLGWVQPGPNGELKQLKTPQTEAGYSEPFNHPELGMVQKGPDGKLYQFKGDKAGQGRDGTGGLDSSVLSQVQQSAKVFHGRMNPDGAFIIPEESREQYVESLKRSEELVARGVPLFAAVNIANLSTVKKNISPDEAEELAEREADSQGLSGSQAELFIQKRSRQIINERGAAQKAYEKYMQQAPTVGAMQSPQQAPATNQAAPGQSAQSIPPQAIDRYNQLIQSAGSDQAKIDKINGYFQETFGTLPQ